MDMRKNLLDEIDYLKQQLSKTQSDHSHQLTRLRDDRDSEIQEVLHDKNVMINDFQNEITHLREAKISAQNECDRAKEEL